MLPTVSVSNLRGFRVPSMMFVKVPPVISFTAQVEGITPKKSTSAVWAWAWELRAMLLKAAIPVRKVRRPRFIFFMTKGK
jgi:hypothetical protein